jgi:hypothetical protein
MDGWTEVPPPSGDMRTWRDSQGDVLILGVLTGLPETHDEGALRQWCRAFAASHDAGLIEVGADSGSVGTTVSLIYKRLQRPAYVFTGMLVVPGRDGPLVWTIVCGEHGTTGVREAVVTAELFGAGRLTLEGYQNSWAQDPYDAAYQGVDRSVLRFVSDDERYDARFPNHPLSKVRRLIAALPTSLELESATPGGRSGT